MSLGQEFFLMRKFLNYSDYRLLILLRGCDIYRPDKEIRLINRLIHRAVKKGVECNIIELKTVKFLGFQNQISQYTKIRRAVRYMYRHFKECGPEELEY